MCSLTYSQPFYIQALAFNENPTNTQNSVKHVDVAYSTEPYVTLAYSELEAYSEPCQISIMENFIQNHA